MTRRQRRHSPAEGAVTASADLGPSFPPAPGGKPVLRADVAVLDRPDPEHPNRTIRGAFRRSGYDWLHARGVITSTQREAADRYCVAHERRDGACEQRGGVAVRTAHWQHGHPAEWQVQAAADIRAVQRLILGANRLVLDGVVIEGRTIESLSTQLAEPAAGIVGRLRAVLDIVAAQWGIG